MFIPKANTPLEMVPWKNWVEKRESDQEKLNGEFRAFMERMGKGDSAGARQTTLINLAAQQNAADIAATNGLPDGGAAEMRLAKLSSDDYDADWVENMQGGMPYLSFNIPGTDSYVELTEEYAPKLVDVQITSPADDEPYEIVFPDMFNSDRDLALPFYVLSIYVYDNSIVLSATGNIPHYMGHPDTYIAGFDPLSETVTLPAGFIGEWFVFCNWQNNDSFAYPMRDAYHAARFGPSITAGDAPDLATTAAAGTSPTVSIAGTSTSGELELVTGTSPTTTGWGELLTFTNPYWVTGETPVLQLYPTNQAAAALSHYAVRSGVEVQAHFDLTGLAASTSYTFNYSLLPFAAV